MPAEGTPVVNIDPPTEEGRRVWAKALDLAEAFGADREWSLIGGLMVQLHGFEHGNELRPTEDIDVLGDARKRPTMTEQIAAVLVNRGAEVTMPPNSNPGLGYRFRVDGEVVEILAPDGLSADPRTVGNLTTLQISGGTQALRRTEAVLVSLRGARPATMRRPSLLGAILIKARVVAERRKGKFDSDRQDLIRLLSYVDDPRALAAEFKAREKAWLQKSGEPLSLDDPMLGEVFTTAALERAGQAFSLLTA